MSRPDDYLGYGTYDRHRADHWVDSARMTGIGEWLRANLFAIALAAVVFGLGITVLSSLELDTSSSAGPGVVVPNGWQPLTVDDDGLPVPNAHACGSISWGIIPGGAPYEGFETDAHAAATKIADASGIPLEYEGHFSLDEFDKVDVLIGWADDPEFPSGAVGLASMGGDGGGLIWLRKTSHNDPGSDGGWGSVMLHEWGHIIGLDHVEDTTSVMNAIGLGERLNRGDRRGLWALGRGSCA